MLRDENQPSSWDLFSWGKDKVTGTITLPNKLAQEMKLSGLTTLNVSDVNSSVIIESSGATTLNYTNSTSLDPQIKLTGAGKVNLDQCLGKAVIDLSGAGRVVANSCSLSALTVDVSGAGEVNLQSGTVGDLDVKTSGAAKVRLPKPTGRIKQDSSGASTLDYF